MNPDLARSLIQLYDMWWNDISTYEGPAGYVLLPTGDDDRLNVLCEQIERQMLDEGMEAPA